MITTEFAPNESWDDALLSLGLLFQPWIWFKGNEGKKVKKAIYGLLDIPIPEYDIFLFLTGRCGLYHALHSFNLPANAEVIVQAFTCEAVILPILANNLKPVYADIEKESYSLDPVALENQITDSTKVVILQHTYGLTPAHRSKIQAIVSRHNLVLIEDIAHGVTISNFTSFISASKSQISNSILLMSFGRSKALSSVFGGAIVTNNKKVIDTLKASEVSLPNPSIGFMLKLLLYKPLSVFIKSTYPVYIGKIIHVLAKKFGLFINEITEKEKTVEYDQLLDKAYPNALALLVSHQFNKYEQMNKNRASICSIYQKSFPNTEYRIPNTFALIRYPLLVENPEKLTLIAAKHGVYLGSWYNQVIAPKSIDLTKTYYKKGSCPVAEEIAKHIINLPTNVSLQEALKVINIIRSDLSKV